MKAIIRKIDRALKRLYNLENRCWAERFLVPESEHTEAAQNAGMQGALLVKAGDPDLSLGIYFSEGVRKQLSDLEQWRALPWSPGQLGAFSVAAEEVSHFNYLVHNASGGRPITQLELEMQGEVDKFLVAFFALSRAGNSKQEDVFQALFDRFFEQFRWADHLTEEEKERYSQANQYAQQFLLKCREDLSRMSYDRVFLLLRQFYRLNASEKISFVLRTRQ